MRKLLTTAFTGAGILHFVRPEPFDSIVPPPIPGSARFWTYTSGAVELVTATLLAYPRTRRAGGLAATGLLLAVWPANIHLVGLWRDEVWWKKMIALARVPLQLPMITGAWRIWRSADNDDTSSANNDDGARTQRV
ncbi:DoxX family protein [Corynebacterium halotolerans]|uniref:Membrane protein n=1 Tax=Corynebacterium halotolerans YIM 70093 = DSM 44683 TaxID=1121362 RepID=M1MYC0_9CORY|nr:membrane protein [Corynebacterium halotolerans]AGF72734.1 membrane protein [Corynebacterium halotolerans YIM 70093 = DSM 44683]